LPFQNTNTTIDELNELEKDLKQTELVDSKKRLKKLGLNEDLLDAFKAVGLLYKEICRDHERVLWFRDTADAKKI
uniref:PHM7_ext domain-containing protein n=1 Tax=Nippostrongylus brasiliensis TaxID=27835 RepID=A0A0N4XRE7_NIPBR